MRRLPSLLLPLLAAVLTACVDPVVPEYDFTTGFLLAEGSIADRPGYSGVRLSRSALQFGSYTLLAVEDARVTSVDGSGAEVSWLRVDDTNDYRPDSAFVGRPGESYYLRIVTPAGELIESRPEVVPTPVPIAAARLAYDREAYYSEDRGTFVPAFSFFVDLADPPEEDNYYQFRFRTYAQLDICKTCERSVYRNGACVATPASRFVPYYDYRCSTPCWSVTRGRQLNVFSDGRNPGGQLRDLLAGRIDYVGGGGQLAELEQYAITAAAFAYGRIQQDLIDGSGGLNAPLPAALYGNLTDRSERGTTVLGYVGAAAVDVARLYWNRDTFPGEPAFRPRPPNPEPLQPSPPTAPCAGPNRTTVRPVGWPE